MVPQIIILVPEFQITANGKLDRKALPQIDHVLNQPSTTGLEEQPLSGIECSLRQAWAHILQKDISKIRTYDHFFKLGGDSISAILLISKYQKLGYQFSVPLVYQYPKLEQQAHLGTQSENMIPEPLLTKYDFPHISLSGTGFQKILAQIHQRGIPLAQVEDILPCIAVQGGLLMNLSLDPSTYLVQMAIKLTGQLDPDQLIHAWASVVNQHSSLRTLFIESPNTLSQGFLQVVLTTLPTAWTISDQPLNSIEAFFIKNRQQGFTLQEHMVRNFVFPTPNSQIHNIIITIHHSLIDGWSLPLLLQQWMVTYHHQGLARSLPHTSFPAVVKYICQSDPTLAQIFWTNYLYNITVTPAPLIYPDYIGLPGYASYSTPLKISKAQLLQITQSLGISIATLFRAAYALVLGQLLNQDDVTFGVIISGRSLNIPGMDQVIGPCTNT
ncbi:condensation domain-containing protein, partial [Dimargaris cristalligena]